MRSAPGKQPGHFCWPELCAADAAEALAFYGDLLGWEAPEAPEQEYVQLLREGRPAAGLLPQAPDTGPARWRTYVAVSSADESACRVQALGGRVRADPFDVPDVGRMAVVEDPVGAELALWEDQGHGGVASTGRPGEMCWNELLTPHVDRARAFYTALLGWAVTPVPLPPPFRGYHMVVHEDRMIGGVMPMDGEQWPITRPHWAIYFTVADCDYSVRRATRGGGKVRVPPTDVPDIGRFAALTDPAGADFSIIQPA